MSTTKSLEPTTSKPLRSDRRDGPRRCDSARFAMGTADALAYPSFSARFSARDKLMSKRKTGKREVSREELIAMSGKKTGLYTAASAIQGKAASAFCKGDDETAMILREAALFLFEMADEQSRRFHSLRAKDLIRKAETGHDPESFPGAVAERSASRLIGELCEKVAVSQDDVDYIARIVHRHLCGTNDEE